MTLVVRSEYGTGYSATAPTEVQHVSGTIRGWVGEKPPLIYFHGYGQDAMAAVAEPTQVALLNRLRQRYAVIVADLALNAFGNDATRARVPEAIAHLTARTGASGKATLVAASMGALGAFGYLLDHPENVQAVAAIIPGLDLADLSARGYSAPINAAYGGAYDDEVHGPTHSPVQYAGDLDAEVPIHLWTSSNDPTIGASTVAAFLAGRPQTMHTNIGAHGHGGIDVAAPLVDEWLRGVG